MDECTVSLWSNVKKKTWTDGAVTLPMQGSGFESKTIIGAVGGDETSFRFVHHLSKSTNKEEVVIFLRKLVSIAPVD